MKRTQLKVKDIVEIRPFAGIVNFISDPEKTVTNYYFTDATADLMAKWLDRIANVSGQTGAAMALAGYRGVGKSHFLAALGGIMAHPELRSRVSDSHVAASAHRLMRRQYPVAHVRRGTKETLFDELKDALAITLAARSTDLNGSLEELLKASSEHGGDLPLILIIDTAFERGTRVARDDGPFLSEIAEVAVRHNIFVGIALDDDIAGADGVNSAIAATFAIDYLDQEHLYKIVDAHIFPKQQQNLTVVHEIYDHFREALPGFRWGEQKFTALYPLHPVVLEVAPFVRLFVHDFALLPFASDAASKILSRPSNSLIALDEVFDNVEPRLREIDELKEAFAAYDRLNSDVIGKIPVMQRLQAKMVLKALMLLSLDGDGANAVEISAAVLIFDEDEPSRAVKNVEGVLESFVNALPDDVRRHTEEGRETRYGLRLENKDRLNDALTAAVETVGDEVMPKILRRLMRERFSDCTLTSESEADGSDSMECQILWRGGTRRGRIFWSPDGGALEKSPASSDVIDWEVRIISSGIAYADLLESSETTRVYWRPDALKREELDTLKRFHILLTQNDLYDKFNEQVRAALHSHTIAVERIFNRIFLADGRMLSENGETVFDETSRAAPTLAEFFSNILAPMFAAKYPQHPIFAQPLGMAEVATLAADMFGGGRTNLDAVQNLAETFALPLGLVGLRGDYLVPEKEEGLMKLPLPASIMKIINDVPEPIISLRTIYSELRKAPYGLGREAQHLILTALAAQRMIEFVTSKGDRISRRSLDLKIIWGDVVAIAKPVEAAHPTRKLVVWAQLLTGNNSFESIEDNKDRAAVLSALSEWLDQWRQTNVLGRFAQIPEELLNTKIWRLTTMVEKTFGFVADTVRSALEESMPLEEALHRVADAFSDSEQEFSDRADDLKLIEGFVDSVSSRAAIRTYLSVADNTRDEELEGIREQLAHSAKTVSFAAGSADHDEVVQLWNDYSAGYSEHFATAHDRVMRSHYLQAKFDEIMRSDRWWEFRNLSDIPMFVDSYKKEAARICSELRQLDCRYDAREMLKEHPFCICSFSLENIAYWESLPDRLSQVIDRGIESYRRTISANRETILPLLDAFGKQSKDKDALDAAARLRQALQTQMESASFTVEELNVIGEVCRLVGTNAVSSEPTSGYGNGSNPMPRLVGSEPVLSV